MTSNLKLKNEVQLGEKLLCILKSSIPTLSETIKLKCGDGLDRRVHRSVLEANGSPLLRNVIRNDTIEVPFSSRIIDVVLEYTYTCKLIECEAVLLIELNSAAQSFGLGDMKEEIERHLRFSLNECLDVPEFLLNERVENVATVQHILAKPPAHCDRMRLLRRVYQWSENVQGATELAQQITRSVLLLPEIENFELMGGSQISISRVFSSSESSERTPSPFSSESSVPDVTDVPNDLGGRIVANDSGNTSHAMIAFFRPNEDQTSKTYVFQRIDCQPHSYVFITRTTGSFKIEEIKSAVIDDDVLLAVYRSSVSVYDLRANRLGIPITVPVVYGNPEHMQLRLGNGKIYLFIEMTIFELVRISHLRYEAYKQITMIENLQNKFVAFHDDSQIHIVFEDPQSPLKIMKMIYVNDRPLKSDAIAQLDCRRKLIGCFNGDLFFVKEKARKLTLTVLYSNGDRYEHSFDDFHGARYLCCEHIIHIASLKDEAKVVSFDTRTRQITEFIGEKSSNESYCHFIVRRGNSRNN